MKIAILTQPLKTNYGGILQAYALQTILQRAGHKVKVINRRYYLDGGTKISFVGLIMRVASFIKTIVRKYVQKKSGYILISPFSPYYHAKMTGLDPLPFVNKYICLSPDIRTSKELNRYLCKQEFDAFVVGSDQVWRPCYSPCITDFFLKEIPLQSKTIKVSYAASFGTDTWEFSSEDTKACAELAYKFDAISVRECSGIRLCKEYLGVAAEHVLDPTLLLGVEDYIRLFEKSKAPKSPGDVFCYVLDENPEVDLIISSIKREGYMPFCAGLDPIKCNMSVEEWLRAFYDAKYVITDSFHACVFSILFGKPFMVISNKARGTARLDSLLETFGLNHCIIESYEDYLMRSKVLKDSFDEDKVNRVLQEWRDKSMKFLSSAGIIS